MRRFRRCRVTCLMAALLVPVATPLLRAAGPEPGAETWELRGGRWWDGSGFSERTLYVTDGRFSAEPPACASASIDLSAWYLVPPYAEAHTHTIAYVPSRLDEFLDLGVFYALVMNVHRSTVPEVLDRFNRIDSVDLAFAVAGVTAADGHPLQIGLRGDAQPEDLDGDWVTIVESIDDLESKWAALAAANPHLIKIFLVDSARYAEHHGSPSVPYRYKGMDPALAAPLVERAHAAGLRVAAHVRTAHDFAVAVRAGVDIIAHLPGFSMGAFAAAQLDDPARIEEIEHPDRFRIAAADARLAAARGVTVVPTIGSLGSVDPELPPETRDRLRRAREVRNQTVTANLSLLRESGVGLATGSDAGEGNPVNETVVLDQLGIFSRAELLTMLTETASRLIFPGRALGRLEPGHEASFLALGGDPTVDLDSLGQIRLRFKQGAPLRPAAAAGRITRHACPPPP